MVTPVNRMGRPRSVARLMRSATITVGDGMTILKQFSIVLPLSKSRISCVPVPTSTARIRMGDDMKLLLSTNKESSLEFSLCIGVYHAYNSPEMSTVDFALSLLMHKNSVEV